MSQVQDDRAMPTVRLEDDVFEALKKLAEPFVDTPSAVVRRLLEEKGILGKRSSDSKSRITTALTPQATYEMFLLSVLAREFGGKGHKRDVTHAVIRQMQGRGLIGAADLELVATGETKAENTITWARNALKGRGLISRLSARGIWELTAEGRKTGSEVILPKRS
jgi:hypothetical protein